VIIGQGGATGAFIKQPVIKKNEVSSCEVTKGFNLTELLELIGKYIVLMTG